MSTKEWLRRRFMGRLVSTPRGRATMLAQIARDEGKGEGGVFESMLSVVTDSKVEKLIARHRADEGRHFEMLWGVIDKVGARPLEIPEELSLIHHLQRELDDGRAPASSDEEQIYRNYLMLLVIEERATEQLAFSASIFAERNPEIGAVLTEIVRDEHRHLRYCHAITKRLAPSEEERQRQIHAHRLAEARAFQKVESETLAFVMREDLFPKPWMRHVWRALTALARFEPLPMTRFATT